MFQSPIHRVNGCNSALFVIVAVRTDCFSPLFIGSMAATSCNRRPLMIFLKVSVPYSSGQWLQPGASYSAQMQANGFQSPIHRVNGCNYKLPVYQEIEGIVSVPYSSGQWLQHSVSVGPKFTAALFQSPIHRANGCNSYWILSVGGWMKVSVPYSSGQWLQRLWAKMGAHQISGFQSPIHRVNGCNYQLLRNNPSVRLRYRFSPLFIGSMAATMRGEEIWDASTRFQSPIHRVNGCNCYWKNDYHYNVSVSVPYSSGQWLQHSKGNVPNHDDAVSVPYSSGQWLQHVWRQRDNPTLDTFQSPIHRVNGCNLDQSGGCSSHEKVSVPYSSGQWLQRTQDSLQPGNDVEFQSPIHRVNGCNWSVPPI